MPNKSQPEGLLGTPQAAKLLKDKEALEQLLRSPDTKALMEMLERQGGLREAADAAMHGDTSRLQTLVGRVMRDPAGAGVVERITKNTPKP